MSREHKSHQLDVSDLTIMGDDIQCEDCPGHFTDPEIIQFKAETVEYRLHCTHCENRLYICHEQPSHISVEVPKAEKASPYFGSRYEEDSDDTDNR